MCVRQKVHEPLEHADPFLYLSALETGLTPEEQKKDKSTMPGMSENPFDKVLRVASN